MLMLLQVTPSFSFRASTIFSRIKSCLYYFNYKISFTICRILLKPAEPQRAPYFMALSKLVQRNEANTESAAQVTKPRTNSKQAINKIETHNRKTKGRNLKQKMGVATNISSGLLFLSRYNIKDPQLITISRFTHVNLKSPIHFSKHYDIHFLKIDLGMLNIFTKCMV